MYMSPSGKSIARTEIKKRNKIKWMADFSDSGYPQEYKDKNLDEHALLKTPLEQWKKNGAHFSPMDDGNGANPDFALGVIDNQWFGVISYKREVDADGTYLLVESDKDPEVMDKRLEVLLDKLFLLGVIGENDFQFDFSRRAVQLHTDSLNTAANYLFEVIEDKDAGHLARARELLASTAVANVISSPNQASLALTLAHVLTYCEDPLETEDKVSTLARAANTLKSKDLSIEEIKSVTDELIQADLAQT